MKALIDSDIFQYEYGNASDSQYKLLSWPLTQSRVQSRIDGIMRATGAVSRKFFLTSDDKSNFRYKVATIQPYKGNRPSEKPHYYNHIRNFLVDYRDAEEVIGKEADDAISTYQYTEYKKVCAENPDLDPENIKDKFNTIIVSRDKDLRITPGWHYSWGAGASKEKPLWFQTELNGLKCFYKQVLTGDRVDNILGLFGVGAKSSYLKDIDNMDNEEDMYLFVYNAYKKRYGSYAKKFLHENCTLLWMLRGVESEDTRWERLHEELIINPSIELIPRAQLTQ